MCVIDHKNLSRENYGLRQRASRYLATLSPQPIVQLPRTYFSQSKLHVTTLTFKNTCRVFFFRQTGGWIRWRAWRWTGWWWACKEFRKTHITVVCSKNVADTLVSKKRRVISISLPQCIPHFISTSNLKYIKRKVV